VMGSASSLPGEYVVSPKLTKRRAKALCKAVNINWLTKTAPPIFPADEPHTLLPLPARRKSSASDTSRRHDPRRKHSAGDMHISDTSRKATRVINVQEAKIPGAELVSRLQVNKVYF
jgi:hypothetical protein